MVMLSFLQWKAESRWWFSCSVVSDFAAPWTTALQASLSFTISWSLLKLMYIELVMPSNHFIPLLLLPSIFPSIRVFFNELAQCIRWPKYWSFSFSFSISPSNEFPDQGSNPHQLHWKFRVLTTGLSGSPCLGSLRDTHPFLLNSSTLLVRARLLTVGFCWDSFLPKMGK